MQVCVASVLALIEVVYILKLESILLLIVPFLLHAIHVPREVLFSCLLVGHMMSVPVIVNCIKCWFEYLLLFLFED